MSDYECIICDQLLSDGTPTSVVKEKGLKSFVEASKKREDGKVDFFKKRTLLEVHERCRRKYTNEKLIVASVKRVQEDGQTQNLRSMKPTFGFKTHCFLCGNGIPLNYEDIQKRYPHSRRNPVYIVRKLEVRENVLSLAKQSNDEYCQAIIQRVEPIPDLVAADAKYHFLCMKNLRLRTQRDVTKDRGRPKDEVDIYMEAIFAYLENSDEECQFTAEELMKKIEGTNSPHWKTVKTRLLERYGNDIFISTKKPYVVCFKNTGYKIITDAWYEQRLSSEKDERRRIVQTAAAIIVEDIRSAIYNITDYPPPDQFLDGNDALIPETLKVFTDSVILNKKCGDIEKLKRKSTAVAHSLIAAVRPRSFISPLQVGLAALLYKKYGSRKLVDLLSSLGFCSSYKEATRFEISSIMRPPMTVKNKPLSQMVYDNADFNVQTLDGYNTFHMMGGIICITPKTSVIPDEGFPRLKDVPSAEEVGKVGAVQLKIFERMNDVGLAGVEIKDLDRIVLQAGTIVPSVPELIWLYSRYKDLPGIGGWNGFMETVTRGKPFQTTFVGCQPFINASPSDYNTIYTALLSGVQKTNSLGQVTTIVTFDQPLYLKARDIIASRKGDPELSNVVIRLGGFHLLMSFLGAVGYIMDGSGLTELFNTVYAIKSTEKIMTGHSYARAVRAHTLAHATLAKIILHSISFSSEVQHEIEKILYCGDRSEILSAYETRTMKVLFKEFEDQIQRLAHLGPTAKLWIQYFEMITLVKKFIESERIGDWTLHLQTIYYMLPYFHASGHYLYAKCAHLYLQDMHELQNIMPPEEYKTFTSDGAFTIRRSDKLWCGTWSDMTIEQNLMKYMKTDGGLTRCRGVTESILSRWTQGMTSLQHVCEEMERFCGVNFSASEQHVDSRDSRIQRDNQDIKKMSDWFDQHPPFPETAELISISTGIVGDEKVNCHLSREIGIQSIHHIIGGDFRSATFKRKGRVNSLATMTCAIKIDSRTVAIKPTTLFYRMSIVKDSDEELEYFLSYELCPYPMSLFDENGMRKGTKSSLYKAFNPMQEVTVADNNIFVVDGGFLLHRVVWSSGQTFADICGTYVEYVCSKYKSSAVIVFDGYSNSVQSTKNVEHLRRLRKKNSIEIMFTDNIVPTVSQENFLANNKNKSRFISMLISKFNEVGIVCKQAKDDADRLIVVTANSLASHNNRVTVVGEDIDLLVIMIGLCSPDNVYFLKPGKGKVPSTLYHPSSAIDRTLADHILFIHAMSGCDTTSALYNQGKLKFIRTLKKNPDLGPTIKVFTDPSADVETVVNAGEQFLIALYGSGKQSLNKLRYRQYITSAYKSTCNIATLPPTEAAARQHSLRVFHQIHLWLGTEKNPEELGWRNSKIGLMPITTLKPPAPDKLLQLISCKCKKDCEGNCGCRRAGLYCSKLCGNCEGTCNNVEKYYADDDHDVEDPDDQQTTQAASIQDEQPEPPSIDHSIENGQHGPSSGKRLRLH